MSDVRQFDVHELEQLSVADRIDLVCDAFENAWIRGETPQIENYLNQYDARSRESLLAELLLVDREFRTQRGETVNRQQYQEQFPEYSTFIDGLEFATIADRRRGRSSALHYRSQVSDANKIAHFELLDRIGSGGSGTVWKARDTKLRRLVAIKVPRSEMLSGPERERFLREGQTCAQLRHPNIVTVHEVGDDHGQVFIAAELIDGVDLRQRLKESRLSPKSAAELAAELAEALHHAHEHDVIHRDLKPANVLIDRNGRPHITDFGLAKWSTGSIEKTVEGNVLGTPAYMSPEQARGDAYRVDRRTDVYALGAVLYEMLTGQPPFQGDMAAVVHQVVHEEPVPPRTIARGIPRDLETICIKAMEKEPSRRYLSVQEMAVDLRRYLCDEPILARRANFIVTTWRWLRRRPAAAALFVLLVVVTLAGLIIASLEKKNFQLRGFRSVSITTKPAGAHVAIVPIDPQTGEPNSDKNTIIRPDHPTPLEVMLTPGDYFIEAALPRSGNPLDFAEAYRTVAPLRMRSNETTRNDSNAESQTSPVTFNIEIPRASDVIADMVEVPVNTAFRRDNPYMPAVIYVDPNETMPNRRKRTYAELATSHLDGDVTETESSFKIAQSWAEAHGKRIASAREYEAIARWVEEQKTRLMPQNNGPISNLDSGLAEWTTTLCPLSGKGRSAGLQRLGTMHLMAGYGDSDKFPELQRWLNGQLIAHPEIGSPMIGFRAVRSGSPRFVNP